MIASSVFARGAKKKALRFNPEPSITMIVQNFIIRMDRKVQTFIKAFKTLFSRNNTDQAA